MEGIAAATSTGKPARWWIAITIAAGIVGGMTTVGLLSAKTYSIPPLRVELSATPSFGGTSQLKVEPRPLPPGVRTGHAEAPTHSSPIDFRMTVAGVDLAGVARQPGVLANPLATARHIRFSEDGKKAIRDFGMRLAMLALAGGAAGGAAVSFGRWKRILGGAVAGLVALGLVGVLLHQTYDVDEFRNTRYVTETPGR